MHKNGIKLISVFIILLALAIGCSANNVDTEKIKANATITYLLNTRTKKVHSKDCGVGGRSKEKNKKYITDSLNNIIASGYTICGDCNAGIKKSFWLDIFKVFDNSYDIYMDYDDMELPSRDQYINAIESIGEWYVGHVPTYCKKLQVEKANEYEGREKNINSINLKSKNLIGNILGTEKNYKYITSEKTNLTIDKLNDDDSILKANENAIANYKEYYGAINVRGGILQYPCKLISDGKDYNMAGDDCVRYIFTILNSIDSQFVARIAKTSMTTWSKIGSEIFYRNVGAFVGAMMKNGFVVYDSKEQLPNSKINKIDENFKLEKGDIICRQGHVHIYIGNDGTDNFGWGKVNRYFPARYNFSVEKSEANDYLIKMDNNNGAEYYTRVYRYVGGN